MRAWLLSLALAAVATPPPAAAQSTPGDEVDPIRCWWRTSAGAVAIGQPFDATLTCAVREDATVRVVADQSRLGADVILLAPFDVLGGSHPADLQTDTHRFFQYQYSVRIIDREAIGRDTKFPDIHVSYRVHTRASEDTVEGRDRRYVLPGQPVRVLSLVPVEADDIRDSADADFAHVETLRFRSRALSLAALALAALGVIVMAPAALRLLRRGSRSPSSDTGRVPARPILTHVAAELAAVQHDKQGGWTPDLVGRAAAAVRVAAASAVERGLSQHRSERSAPPTAGRLTIRTGRLRRAAVTISSPVTPLDLAAALDHLPLGAEASARQRLEDLHAALRTFTAALYAPSFEPDEAALDQALHAALTVTRHLRQAHSWPRTLFRRGPSVRTRERVP